jgi:microsomal epoxide hydrolase
VVEFLDVIGPLTETFHVVCPSIPGYAFSGPTRHTGVHVHSVADRLAELMDRLGYDRFVAQGGDWGSEVTRWLGSAHPDRVIGIHLNMLIIRPPDRPDAFEGLTEAELAAMGEAAEFVKTGVGYLQLQSTKPQTLAYGLADSPAGLAAWIVEKFHAWTDHDGDVEQALSRDQMLANITTYWVTGTANSASRLYLESMRDRGPSLEMGSGAKVAVPAGCAIYPGEIIRPPRKWAEEVLTDIVHWAEMPKGGHFAAFEQPELFVADLEAFAAKL